MTKQFKLAVILNGPPGCGKDTIANRLIEEQDKLTVTAGQLTKRQFKDALYEHTAKHFQVDLDKFIHFASDRDLKDSKSLAGLGGRTPRQALIHVSEDIYKPRFGSDYFGKAEADSIRELAGRVGGSFTVIYPDGGFASEIPPLESVVDFVLIVQLHRDGFDFTGDSRSYLNLPNTASRFTVNEWLTEGNIGGGVFLVRNWIERILWNKI